MGLPFEEAPTASVSGEDLSTPLPLVIPFLIVALVVWRTWEPFFCYTRVGSPIPGPFSQVPVLFASASTTSVLLGILGST